VTTALPGEGRGFWIRYTTLDPATHTGSSPESALWLMSFNRSEPSRNMALKQVLPRAAAQVSPHPFHLQVGDAWLDSGGCRGRLKVPGGEAEWDLAWERLAAPFAFVPPRWEWLASASNIAAAPALAVSGRIAVNGEEVRLQRAPGGQQHTWGSRHALEWNWGFAAGLGDDPAAWFDGVSTRVRSRLGRELLGTAAGLERGGLRVEINSPLTTLRQATVIAPGAWTARVSGRDALVTATVSPRREDLTGVTYADPAGGMRYCYHSEVADLTLTLTGRDGVERMAISQPAAAAYEYACSVPLEGIPLSI
jgi:hypothetical protein